MVILVKKIPNTKNRNTLHAYVSKNINNETKLVPVSLEINILKSIAKNMNILQDGQEYESAMKVPMNVGVETPSSNNEVYDLDSSEIIDIDDNILDDSIIDNYILTGKTNLLTSDPLNSPNIINLSTL